MSEEFVGYTVCRLKEMPRQHFINELGACTTSLDSQYSTSQEKSWGDCYDYLTKEFQNTTIYYQ